MLLSEISNDERPEEIHEVVSAAASLFLPAADVAVVVSPHGRAAGIYEDLRVDVADFGASKEFSCALGRHDGATRKLADRWGMPLLEGLLDHGFVGPCDLFGPLLDVDSVACTLPEVTGPDAAPISEARSAAEALAGAIVALADELDVLVVASAHLGAASSPRAPDGYRPETARLDHDFIAAYERDVGSTLEIIEALAGDAASCGLGPLRVLARCFDGIAGTSHAYSRAFGVGYLVASVSAPGAPPPRPSPARAVLRAPDR